MRSRSHIQVILGEICQLKEQIMAQTQFLFALLFKNVFIHVFYVYECSVFVHTRRGHQTPLQMVVSHHVLAGS